MTGCRGARVGCSRADDGRSRTPVVPTTTRPSVARRPASARSAGPPAVVEGARDGRLDRPPRHRPAPSDMRSSIAADRIVPIGLARSRAGDVRRRAVDRLVQPERAVRGPALAERRRRQHPEAAGEDRRLVGQDVAEQVLGDDDVEVGRPADEQHRARVDELVVERDVREVASRPRRRPSATAATSRGRWPCRRWSRCRGGSGASSNASRTIRADLVARRTAACRRADRAPRLAPTPRRLAEVDRRRSARGR